MENGTNPTRSNGGGEVSNATTRTGVKIVEDWLDRQNETRQDAPRGPRPGFTEPDEEKPKSYTVFHETYLIFRPWTVCKRCKDKIEQYPEDLPSEGEFTCVHTNHKDYIILVNKLRNAGSTGPIKLSAREYQSDRGEIYVTIAWEETESTAIETQKRIKSIPRL